MTYDQFQKKLQDIANKIESLENDLAMQRVRLAALTCSETKYEDLDKSYVIRMKIDSLIDDMQELAEAYYKTTAQIWRV